MCMCVVDWCPKIHYYLDFLVIQGAFEVIDKKTKIKLAHTKYDSLFWAYILKSTTMLWWPLHVDLQCYNELGGMF